MRRLFISILLCLLTVHTVCGQDLYLLEFTDLQGHDNIGLMQMIDEENISMRLLTLDANSNIIDRQDIMYISETEKDGNDEYTVMASADNDAPNLAFYWNEDIGDEEFRPYMSIGDAELFHAKSFRELELKDVDEETISLFYDKNESQYRQLLDAIGLTRQTADATVTHLEDGEGIFMTVITEIARIQNRDVKDLADNYIDVTEENSEATGSGMPTMHLILAVNTTVEDIGEPCSKDYDNVLREMRGVTQALGMPLKLYPVKDKQFSRHQLQSALNSVRPGDNDVILFLYSGHGFRWDNQESRFPNMVLLQSNYADLGNNYMAMSDVYRQLSNKGARLSIVMSDCCNTEYGEDAPVGKGSTLYARSNGNFSLERAKELFLHSRGSILSTASSPGEESICNQAGGFYTLGFIRSLRNEMSALNKQPVSWTHVMDNTIDAARKRSEKDTDGKGIQHGIKFISEE
ncbi:MAG: caspase family protein [Prevotella sp.]|uniref:caspase family protein n=1 Tax=Prevotella sp. TaxID=59823 RepID=UPI002A2BAA0F|nr:caspase family protein [Prevotella sp.]MDD7317800.1 caspase family protein [Prevotellaceae bacterium]MDY4020715.1 caspase family protein [Prevotella sp.]